MHPRVPSHPTRRLALLPTCLLAASTALPATPPTAAPAFTLPAPAEAQIGRAHV